MFVLALTDIKGHRL